MQSRTWGLPRLSSRNQQQPPNRHLDHSRFKAISTAAHGDVCLRKQIERMTLSQFCCSTTRQLRISHACTICLGHPSHQTKASSKQHHSCNLRMTLSATSTKEEKKETCTLALYKVVRLRMCSRHRISCSHQPIIPRHPISSILTLKSNK